MNFSQTIHGELPKLTLSVKELAQLMINLFADSQDSYSFTGFTNRLSDYLLRNQIGFEYQPNTTYIGTISMSDENRIREIIWDFIILRYLTVGSYGHHEWPNFTITDRGKQYFIDNQIPRT